MAEVVKEAEALLDTCTHLTVYELDRIKAVMLKHGFEWCPEKGTWERTDHVHT